MQQLAVFGGMTGSAAAGGGVIANLAVHFAMRVLFAASDTNPSGPSMCWCPRLPGPWSPALPEAAATSAAVAMMTSASVTLTPSTSTSGSDVHSNGSGVKVTSTPLTVIVT